jgi:NAD(P)-dependent dehydrogenase (short-subunit alcohol dehydrogenase family)
MAAPTVLVTGATDGLGKALAHELAREGATVLLHGRDERRVREAMEEIGADTGNDSLRVFRADLASLAEVRALADEVLDKVPRLDVLVNNAGIGTTLPGGGARQESKDGYELRFQINYLAGFLLTRLLEPLLARSTPSRVVNVSSAGQMPIDFDDVMLERSYDGPRAYCQSKLAQVMFTFELSRRRDGGDPIATCLHPATYMPTKMVIAAGVSPISTVDQGVEATRRLVFEAADAVDGRYFNGLAEARANPQAYDAEARDRLWRLSESLTASPPTDHVEG